MILCMLVASTIVMPVHADTDQSISVQVSGPAVVGIGDVTQYTVKVAGGPAGQTNGTYGCQVAMSGFASANATLFSAGSNAKTGVFVFNLTTPKIAGGLTINFQASSKSLDGSLITYNNDTKTNVQVVNPIVFTVNIRNTGNMTVTNIPVYFYVDSNQVHVVNVTIDPQSSKVINYNWTVTGLSSGKHELKVQIDPNATFVLFDVGGTVMTTTFYFNESGYGTTNALLYVAVVVLAVVAYLIYRRPAPRKKK
jgi:hypothetical protein